MAKGDMEAGQQRAGRRTAEVIERVGTLAEPILADQGLTLVAVEFQRESRGWILRVYIDRPGGVRLEDCERVSEELSVHLDVEDIIEYPYHLEVSSPGLDRPLTRDADFLQFAGKAARITTREPLNGQRNFRGRLDGMVDHEVLLTLEGGRQVRIPRDLITKARLEIEL